MRITVDGDLVEISTKRKCEKELWIVISGKPISPINIKNLPLGKSINGEKRMLMEIFKHSNDQMEALVGKEYTDETLQRYEKSSGIPDPFWKAGKRLVI